MAVISSKHCQQCLVGGGATMTTHIGDRESDVFEEFATVPNQQNHVLVRSCQNRRLLDKSVLLYEYLSQQPIEGTYIINVPADARTNCAAREALVMVRRARVQIQRPEKLNAFDYPSSVTLYAVEAVEVNPPTDTQPIHWRLLTTHTVVCRRTCTPSH